MKPTVKYIQDKFDEFNNVMFGGHLPRIPIELSDAASFLGQCSYIRTRHPDGRMSYSDFKLRISRRVDYPENVVEDTIIHEMIHYFILYHNLHDTSTHGEIFKSIMRSINSTYNRNLSVTHHQTAEERERAVDTRRSWHIIARVVFKNGKTGVKVLPRVIPKVLTYFRTVSTHPDVQGVELFLHDNPFFNRYPNSAALRVYDIDSEIFASNLEGARRLKVAGSSIIEDRPKR